jgi:hypothetical protein
MIDMVISGGDHGCWRCGQDLPLYTLKLRPGEAPVLVPNQPTTHAGACRGCWFTIGSAIIHEAVLIPLTTGGG